MNVLMITLAMVPVLIVCCAALAIGWRIQYLSSCDEADALEVIDSLTDALEECECDLLVARLAADELRQENHKLAKVITSMSNPPSVRKTAAGYVMPIDIRRGSK